MARLLHGALLSGENFSNREIFLGLTGALMHDSGMIQESCDSEGTGAKYTQEHVQLSMDFVTKHAADLHLNDQEITDLRTMIQGTDLMVDFSSINFSSSTVELLGKTLGTADLIAQMADRTYLEKLPLLYREFKEAGTENYDCELDLIKDANQFNSRMNDRLTTQLDCANRFFRTHFRVRWNLDADLYQVAIDRAMTYLAHILKSDLEHYRIHLRRALPRTFHKAG
jgi:hypothetical protein